jgi:hypothetical protein
MPSVHRNIALPGGCGIFSESDDGKDGMLLSPSSRFFLRHELRLRTPRDQGVPLPFLHAKTISVANVLQKAMTAGKASFVLAKKDVVRLTALDIREKDQIAVLLFRRSDPEAATPIFEDENTRQLRKSDKKTTEAIAVSAHMFIRLDEVAGAAHPTYRAILEEVPGLSRTYIHSLLHSLIREVTYQYTDKRGEKKDTYTIVDFHGQKSEKIGGALKGNSVVPSVILVRPGSVKGLDTEGLVIPREQRMKLLIKAKPAQTLGILKKIQSWMKDHDWPKLLVEMHMPEERTRIVQLAREQDAADILFIRSVPIDVETPLEACTDTINEELVAKAQDLFASDE